MTRERKSIQKSVPSGPAAALALLLLAGCTPALPVENRPVEIARYSIAADFSAQDAKKLAEEVRAERERADELLQQARRLAERAFQAEKRCRDLAAKIPKKPKIIYVRPKPEKKKPQETDAPDAEATPVPTGPVVPLYSPSDAPPGAAVAPQSGKPPAAADASGPPAAAGEREAAAGEHDNGSKPGARH